MKSRRKRQAGVMLSAILCAGLLLTGCGDEADEDYSAESVQAGSDSSEEKNDSSGEENQSEGESSSGMRQSDTPVEDGCRVTGSVDTLDGRTLYVTVMVNDGSDHQYTEDEFNNIITVQKNIANYLHDLAAQYGKDCEIVTVDDDHQDLMYEIEYPDAVAASKSDGSEQYAQFKMDMMEALDTQIPNDELAEEYGTDSIGYFLVLPGECPDSFWAWRYNPYYTGMGYREFVTQYLYYGGQPTQTTVLLHEVMHTFGAQDFYSGSMDYVPPELEEWFNTCTERQIMIGCGEDPSVPFNEGVNKFSIDDVSLARLGLIDYEPIVEQYPDLDFRYGGNAVYVDPEWLSR